MSNDDVILCEVDSAIEVSFHDLFEYFEVFDFLEVLV